MPGTRLRHTRPLSHSEPRTDSPPRPGRNARWRARTRPPEANRQRMVDIHRHRRAPLARAGSATAPLLPARPTPGCSENRDGLAHDAPERRPAPCAGRRPAWSSGMEVDIEAERRKGADHTFEVGGRLAALEFSHQTGGHPRDLGELNLGQMQLDPARAYPGAEIVGIGNFHLAHLRAREEISVSGGRKTKILPLGKKRPLFLLPNAKSSRSGRSTQVFAHPLYCLFDPLVGSGQGDAEEALAARPVHRAG